MSRPIHPKASSLWFGVFRYTQFAEALFAFAVVEDDLAPTASKAIYGSSAIQMACRRWFQRLLGKSPGLLLRHRARLPDLPVTDFCEAVAQRRFQDSDFRTAIEMPHVL